jgi:hypothetical protein
VTTMEVHWDSYEYVSGDGSDDWLKNANQTFSDMLAPFFINGPRTVPAVEKLFFSHCGSRIRSLMVILVHCSGFPLLSFPSIASTLIMS